MSGSDFSQPAPPGPLRREPALDGIRGLATLAVMLFHFTMFEQSSQPLFRAALGLASLGWASIDLFFVLSGFLITGILLDTKGQQHFFRNFYLRRALRIVPLCYAVLAVVMLAVSATVGLRTPESREFLGRQLWLWTYTTNIEFFVSGHWNFNLGRLWLNHFWTLAVEEQFYLAWPVIVFALSRRALVVGAVGLALGAPLLRAIMIVHGVRPGIVLTLTPCRVDALALGALAAVLVRDSAVRPRVLCSLPWVALAALPPLVWLGWTRRLYWLDPIVVVVAFSALAVLACAAVLQCALKPGGRLARPLRSPVLGLRHLPVPLHALAASRTVFAGCAHYRCKRLGAIRPRRARARWRRSKRGGRLRQLSCTRTPLSRVEAQLRLYLSGENVRWSTSGGNAQRRPASCGSSRTRTGRPGASCWRRRRCHTGRRRRTCRWSTC